MKNALIIALLSLTSANAFALPKTAEIVRMDLDPYAFGGQRILSGYISLDVRAREASITLQPAMKKCAPSKACVQVMPEPIVITLPVISRVTNRCGAVVYTAQHDARPSDGLFQKLVITDNSKSRCLSIPRFGTVFASYETEIFSRSGGKGNYSTFEASAFGPAAY